MSPPILGRVEYNDEGPERSETFLTRLGTRDRSHAVMIGFKRGIIEF